MTELIKASDFVHFAPVLFVAGWACLVLFASAFGAGKSLRLGPLSALGTILGIVFAFVWWGSHASGEANLFGGMIVVDRFALFLDIVLLVSATLTVLVSTSFLQRYRCAHSEFFAVILLALSGMMLMVHAGDFITLVIGLETMSLGIYGLVACWWGKRESAEAGMKYFIMGAIASAVLLYGIALLYGATGSTLFSVIAAQAGQLSDNAIFVTGMLLVLVASAFKVALVPFHMWAPDAYQGAPTPITGFMASAVKAAGFGVLIRVLVVIFGDESLALGATGWATFAFGLSVLTMTVGNLAALFQRNIKRMLAYSSISHAGYMLIGVITLALQGGELKPGPMLYYLLSYAATTVGAFAVVSWIGSRENERVDLEDWKGLAARHPAMALLMMLFLASLAGIPPTGGFFAKFYLFKAAIAQPGMLELVIIAVLNSVISVFYYLRPIVAMYFQDETETHAAPASSPSLSGALSIAAVLVLILGLLPSLVFNLASTSSILSF